MDLVRQVQILRPPNELRLVVVLKSGRDEVDPKARVVAEHRKGLEQSDVVFVRSSLGGIQHEVAGHRKSSARLGHVGRAGLGDRGGRRGQWDDAYTLGRELVVGLDIALGRLARNGNHRGRAAQDAVPDLPPSVLLSAEELWPMHVLEIPESSFDSQRIE